MDAWFESAAVNDERQLGELLKADPTLLNRIHPQHERTALQIAAAWDASRAVAFFLDNGVDMYASDPEGLTVLHLVAASNGVSTLEILLLHDRHTQHQKLHSSGKTYGTPKAAKTEEAMRVSLVSRRSRDGYTALLLAAALGHHECCSLLLSLGGADPRLALDTPPFLTALDLALLGQHYQVVACLQDFLI